MMSIRYITIAVATVALVVFSVFSYVVSKSIIVDGFEYIEDEQARTDISRAVNSINTVVNYVEKFVVDWAYWDDAYKFVQDRNKKFIKSNLNLDTFVKQKIDFILFVGEKKNIVWGTLLDSAEGKLISLPEAIKSLAKEHSPLLLEKDSVDGCKGVVVLEGKPYLVASRRIHDSDMKLPSKGVCIAGRVLDQALVDEIKESTKLAVAISVLAPGGTPARPSEDSPRLVKNDEEIRSSLLVKDVYMAPALDVTVTDDRSVMSMGVSTFKTNFALVFGACASLGLIFMLVLEYRVLRRIHMIQEQAGGICNADSPVRRIAIDGNDELSRLAENINRMLVRLESSDVFLQQALDCLHAGFVLISPRDNTVASINSFAAKLIGLSKERIIGRACGEFIRPLEAPGRASVAAVQPYGLSIKSLATGQGQEKTILSSAGTLSRDGKDFLLETFVDITDLQAAQQALQATEGRYQAVFMNTGTANVMVAADTTITLANMEFVKLSGYQRAEIEDVLCIKDFFSPDQAVRILEYHEQRKVNTEFAPREYESVFVDRGGTRKDVHMTVSMIDGTEDSIISFLDISDRKRVEKQLMVQAFQDGLTGLPNRALLYDRIEHAIKSSSRENLQVGVLLLDLDRFKQVNDSLGHAVGDRLLCLVAGRLAEAVRANDTVARLGGDEFVLVIENSKDVMALAQIANKILVKFKTPFDVDGHILYIGVSIGISSYPEDGEDPDALIKNADLAMYKSKERGKNMYSLFTQELNDQALAKLTLENDLRRAFETQSFFVVYQPKVNSGTNSIIGCEALVRWRNESGEFISPGDFIPLAEETGLIADLDAWVMEQACMQVKQWQAGASPGMTLAVNLSARNFQSEATVERITGILEKTGFPPHLLEIEITETALISNWKNTEKIITFLSSLNIRISLDDFGTGYSSLSYLQQLPIGCLKIDKRFIDGLSRNAADSQALVRTIISLAGNLSIDVVAEGVETLEQLAFLRDNGCGIIQGYLYSPPRRPEDFEALLGRPILPQQPSPRAAP